MIIIWIIIAILIFTIIVMVHEWWHFKAARIFWVKVEEFGIWIPPRAKKLFTDKKWTLFSLNWLPLWGFVKLTWETQRNFLIFDEKNNLLNNENLKKFILENKEIFDKKWNKIWKEDKIEILKILSENEANYNLNKKPAWQQSIIILAGIFMNFVLAFFIFFILFLVWVKPIWINNHIKTSLDLKLIPTLEQAINNWILEKKPGIILSPVSWSLAEKSWIQKWDIILKINDEEINSSEIFMKKIKENKGKTIILTKSCKNKENCKEKIYINIDEAWKIWSYISENITINKDFEYKFWVLDSAKYAFLETKNQVLLTFSALSDLAKKIFTPETKTERQEAINSMSWPIWIVNFISETFSSWILFLLIIWALISINLWVFNLLPIPALDWWRFLFIILNSIFSKIFWKKFFSENMETIIHFIFFMILIALSLIIWYNDIVKIFW